MNAQRLEADSAVALEGLEDLFKWASETVSDGADVRSTRMREQRIRRQVMEIVQREREQRAVTKANIEIAYLQRRVIALLQQLQESIENNGGLKQTVIAQQITLQKLPELENEIERLKSMESHVEKYQAEQQELLNAISRLKKDRDFLDDLLHANEEENSRLSALLADVRAELAIKSRRWWHIFWPPRQAKA